MRNSSYSFCGSLERGRMLLSQSDDPVRPLFELESCIIALLDTHDVRNIKAKILTASKLLVSSREPSKLFVPVLPSPVEHPPVGSNCLVYLDDRGHTWSVFIGHPLSSMLLRRVRLSQHLYPRSSSCSPALSTVRSSGSTLLLLFIT
jgi:hypothetical protein